MIIRTSHGQSVRQHCTTVGPLVVVTVEETVTAVLLYDPLARHELLAERRRAGSSRSPTRPGRATSSKINSGHHENTHKQAEGDSRMERDIGRQPNGRTDGAKVKRHSRTPPWRPDARPGRAQPGGRADSQRKTPLKDYRTNTE